MTRDKIEHVRGELQKLADVEGDKPLARRLGVPFGQLRSMLEGRDPLVSNLARIAEALDLEFYVGPPRPTDPTSFPSTLAALDYQEVRAFQTRVSEAGNVGLKLDGTKTSAIVLLQPDLSKALADELTHRAMQIEESE